MKSFRNGETSSRPAAFADTTFRPVTSLVSRMPVSTVGAVRSGRAVDVIFSGDVRLRVLPCPFKLTRLFKSMLICVECVLKWLN